MPGNAYLKGSSTIKRGFSLVELLVVIAIIGVLAALLLPGLSRAKTQAKETVCLNNLKQIGVGIKMYQNDNDSRFPLERSVAGSHGALPPAGPIPGAKFISFRFAIGGDGDAVKPGMQNSAPASADRPLFAYVKAREVFRCPADAGFDESMPNGPKIRPTLWAFTGCSYQYNGQQSFEPEQVRGLAGQKEQWVEKPGQFVLMHESAAQPWDPDNEQRVCVYWHRARKPGSARGRPDRERGPRVSPILFVDGHVSWLDCTDSYSSQPGYPTCIWLQLSPMKP